MTQTNNEREAFEKWYQSQFTGKVDFKRYSANPIYYDNDDIDTSWEAWEARAQSPISQNEQQEVVAIGGLSEFAKAPIGRILKNGEIDLYDTQDVLNEMVGFEVYIHPHSSCKSDISPTKQAIPEVRVYIEHGFVCVRTETGQLLSSKKVEDFKPYDFITSSPTTSLTSETNTEVGE